MFYLTKKFAHLFPKKHLTIFFLLFYDILNNDSVLFYDLSSSTFLILLKLLLRYLIPLYQILQLLRNLISLIKILMVMFMLRLSCGFRRSCSWHFHIYCCSWWFLVCYRFYWQCSSIWDEPNNTIRKQSMFEFPKGKRVQVIQFRKNQKGNFLITKKWDTERLQLHWKWFTR